MSDPSEHAAQEAIPGNDALSASEKRLNELDELQQQVAKRLRDNQRFLERFMDDAYEDEAGLDLADDEPDDEPFEEL